MTLNHLESNFIRPLALAENQFLQVLLPSFSMKRSGGGVVLSLAFGNDSAAIWTRQAKHEVQKEMGTHFERTRESLQARLDSFLLENQGQTFKHEDPCFPFRYGSGGTLPILRIDDEDYFALFFRDIFPIGWNIANGGCDTREELFNPAITIERELREELVVVNTQRRKRYVFEGDNDKLLDRPEFTVARKVWQQHLPLFDITKFGELIIPLKWLEGPDSVSLIFENGPPKETKGFFLNVNAEDFGIELDKVARLSLDGGDILCDGEIIQGNLVNAPIGLFRADSMSLEKIEANEEFVPERIYYNAELHAGSELRTIVEQRFIPYIDGLRDTGEIANWNATKERYRLCPVTKRILKRYLPLRRGEPTPEQRAFDTFICFASEDRELARTVYDFLTQRRKKVFFSEQNAMANFPKAIDEALVSAKSLVAVGTQQQHLRKPFPAYEYRAFHDYILFEKKPDTTPLLSFITGFDPRDLPPPLCHHKGIVADPRNLTPSLEELARHLPQ